MTLSWLHRWHPKWANWAARPAVWLGLAGVLLTVDFLSGPAIQFPVVFIFPVALAAWHRRVGWALGFAVGQSAIRFCFHYYWDTPWSFLLSAVNALICVVVLCGFAWLVWYVTRQRHHIATLERLLPVCAWCKRIRDESGTWQPLDRYLSERANLAFTHGICPDCLRKQKAESARA
jgi:hypothetical protein